MQYQGGKVGLAKYICPIIQALKPQVYIEPFCGACAIIEHIQAKKRIASDVSEVVIVLFKAIQDGFTPPDSVNEEEYKQALTTLRTGKTPTAFEAFALVACSFAGTIAGGYARSFKTGKWVNFALRGKKALEKSFKGLKGIEFFLRSYKHYTCENTKNAVIYCDPPYENTGGYKSVKEPFLSDEFWQWASELSRENLVLISEFQARDEFVSVWERERPMKRHKGKKAYKVKEKLLIHKSAIDRYESAKQSIDYLFERAFREHENFKMVM